MGGVLCLEHGSKRNLLIFWGSFLNLWAETFVLITEALDFDWISEGVAGFITIMREAVEDKVSYSEKDLEGQEKYKIEIDDRLLKKWNALAQVYMSRKTNVVSVNLRQFTGGEF